MTHKRKNNSTSYGYSGIYTKGYRRNNDKMTKSIREEYKIKNLCLAGGVALNCVANGKIFTGKVFDNIWIQPWPEMQEVLWGSTCTMDRK